MKPNAFDSNDEKKYIERMINLTDQKRDTIPIDTHVRTVLPRDTIGGKRRSTFSQNSYSVDGYSGNQYIIRAKDHSTAIYPRHQLTRAKGNIRLADTIDNDAQGIIERIESHGINAKKKPIYNVMYEGGVKDKIPLMNLRETRPTVMSRVEKTYWLGKNIPEKFR